MKRPKFVIIILISILLIIAIIISKDFLNQIGLTFFPNYPQIIATEESEPHLQNSTVIHYYSGFPGLVQTNVTVTGVTPTERARNYLNTYQALYLQNSPNLALEVKEVRGESVVFYQTYKGLTIHGAEIVVNLKDDQVFSTVGNLMSDIDLDIHPTLNPNQALDIGREYLSTLDALQNGEVNLVVIEPNLLIGKNQGPHLAWRFTLGIGEPFEILVDAHTAKVLLSVPLFFSSIDLDMQDAENEANAIDDYCYWWSNDSFVADENEFNHEYDNNPDAVQGNYFAYRAYDFYLDNFNRKSYDDNDSQLEIFINATIDNASWNLDCNLIQFRQGYMDFDIFVHEFTHGVISNTSSLYYYGQSGALNESYADIMGAFADRWLPNSPFTSGIDWTIGEDRTDGNGASRDIRWPPFYGQPYHLDDYFVTDQDFGGVHTNSGIFNFATVLMATGGYRQEIIENNSVKDALIDVDPIGEEKTLLLAYQTMITLPKYALLTQASGNTLIWAQAWVDWGGLNGFVQDDVCQIRNAFAAAGLELADTDCDGQLDDSDFDIDNDGILNFDDNCYRTPNANQNDINFDGIGDACQPDKDKDGVPNIPIPGGLPGFLFDNCPNVPNYDQKDTNMNMVGDACDDTEDFDSDNDGINDLDDNCPLVPNHNQENVDNHLDDLGDACDPDSDGDGFSNDNDNCPFTPNSDQADKDNDSLGDACDLCQNNPDKLIGYTDPQFVGPDGNPPDPQPFSADSDHDGIPDACDQSQKLDGRPWGHILNPVRADGEIHQAEIEGYPKTLIQVPLPLCPQDTNDGYSENLGGMIVLEGLDPHISPHLISGDGKGAGKPVINKNQLELNFDPIGGQNYFLQLFFGPEYPPGQISSFTIAQFCGPKDSLISPPKTPQQSPSTSIPPTEDHISCNLASFVSDVTVPDGTVFTNGEAFTKTWRIKNIGSCPWTRAYELVFFSGDRMYGPESQAFVFDNEVAPDQTIDISVDLVAPRTEGNYVGYWKLKNSSGELFGLTSGNPFYVDIIVNESGNSISSPIIDPTASSGIVLVSPNITIEYTGSWMCDIYHYAYFKINNTGNIAIESLSIELQGPIGTYLNTTNQNNPFYPPPPLYHPQCGLEGAQSLSIGEEKWVSIAYILATRGTVNGRVIINVCTQNALVGVCKEKTLDFTW